MKGLGGISVYLSVHKRERKREKGGGGGTAAALLYA